MTKILILFLSLKAWALPIEQVNDYEKRYVLNTNNQKLVDNRGDGYEDLYGTRNFRVVLKGIVYRGGGNNAYNKYGARDNRNPLPELGLKNLCQEGFKSAVYLYTTNFSTASKQVNCQDFSKQENQLEYKQISGLDANNVNVFLEMFYKVIKGEILSPIYVHCWNGWHASGLVSTLALRQFCGYSAQQALAYWTANTDGNSDGYSAIKKAIQDFVPRNQYQITESEKREICLQTF
jgi:hypothetical protein